MTFGKVAMAILMYKTIELAWAYAMSIRPTSIVETVVIVTLAWLVSWGFIWKTVYLVKELVFHDHPLRGTVK